jgi:tetratricopeptide (TPR) repeat protein
MTGHRHIESPGEVGARDRLALAAAAGVGAWAGLLAAGFSQLLGVPAPPVVALAYLFGMSRLRGWKELAGLLSLMTVVVVYFLAYDVIRAVEPGAWGVAGVVVGAAAVACVSTFLVGGLVGRVRANALATAPRGPFGRPRREPIAAEDVDCWEAGYFTRLRTLRTGGWRYWLLMLRPWVWSGAMLVITAVAEFKSVKAVATSVAIFQMVVGLRLSTYARRLIHSGVAEALLWDVRSPVLLLRSFSLDTLPAEVLDRKRVGFNFASWFEKRSFEEYLAEAFEQVGPVIAIGRPGETVAPLGAARDYVGDDAWQKRVLAHAKASQCVLMLADDSPGMAWEIEHVIEAVGLPRVVVVLPAWPEWALDHEDHDEQVGRRAWERRWVTLRSRFPVLPEVTMQTGAVLYNDSCQPVLVDAGDSVDERVRAIRAAWHELRGQTPATWRDSDVSAAKQVLTDAMLATAAVLGEPARGGRRRHWETIGQRVRRVGRRAVGVREVPAAIADVERKLAEVRGILGPAHGVTGILHFLLGRLFLTSGDAARARDELTLAVNILRAETGALGAAVIAARRMLAGALAGTGDFEGACREYQAVLDAIADGVGVVAPDSSRRALRENALERALGIGEMDLTSGSLAEAGVRTELALTCHRRGDLTEARAAFEPALPVLDSAEPGMSREERASLGVAHDRYGLVLYALGDREAARAEHERALTILRNAVHDGHMSIAAARSNLGLALKALGQRDAARAAYEQAVAAIDAVLGPGTENIGGAVDLATPYANLGTLLYELGEQDAARMQLERAIALSEAAVGPDHARMGGLRCTYGTILAALGDRDAARAELERAVEISERALGTGAAETRLFRKNLAAVST